MQHYSSQVYSSSTFMESIVGIHQPGYCSRQFDLFKDPPDSSSPSHHNCSCCWMPKPTWRGLSRTGWRTTRRRRCSWLLPQVQRHSLRTQQPEVAAADDCAEKPTFSFLQTLFNDQVTLNWWACYWSGEQTPWWEPCTVMASRRHRRETWTPTAWQQLTDTGG